MTNAYGTTLYAQVSAINNAAVEGAFSAGSAGTVLLDPAGDQDHDGMSNAAEDLAGTNPLDPNSVLQILSLGSGNLVTWSAVPGKTYRVFAVSDLAASFTQLSGVVTAVTATATYLDAPPTNAHRFYRVNVLP